MREPEFKVWPTPRPGETISVTIRDETLEEKRERLISELLYHSNQLGHWMSAALDDAQVCADMKDDIWAWMRALDALEGFPDE